MSLKFSIVIPTRHRPAFVNEALRYVAMQTYHNYEVIVSDNYVDSEQSCENVFLQANVPNSIYVRPEVPLNMIENWNFAVSHAKGDYILVLTDKMFLLPDTLHNANKALSIIKADIVNWIDNSYTSINEDDYFGEGYYVQYNLEQRANNFTRYEPLAELSKKGIAEVARGEQDKSTYTRGKICFGCYSQELVERICSKYGALFHSVSPDYTSMILALSEARICIELATPGIVHINTNISNGGQGALNDLQATSYYNLLPNTEEVMDNLLIPKLYVSQANGVVHDYLYLKKKFQLPFELNKLNWLVYIFEDLHNKNRKWSSVEVKEEQNMLFQNYLNTLSIEQSAYVYNKIEERKRQILKEEEDLKLFEETRLKKSRSGVLGQIKNFIPEAILKVYYNIRLKLIEKEKPNELYSSLQKAIENNII